MKKYLITALAIFTLPLATFAYTTFYSGQVGSSPVSGKVLQTDGTNSTWVATSTLGFTAGEPLYIAASSTLLRAGTTTEPLYIAASSTLLRSNGNASTTNLSVATDAYFTPLTSTLLAVDANHKLIATSTSAGGVTAVTGTYPVISNGGNTPAISLAFGTTTSNTWAGVQTFTNASTTNLSVGTSAYLTPLTSSYLAVDANHKIIATTTPVSAAGVKLPSYIVAASGGDYTTIQGALDACGTAGGGTIYLTDVTYAQGGTGLVFKGSNCNIYGRDATTTITFTGATTWFKTNSAAGQYSNNGIHHVVLTGDGNASSVAIDASNMTHATYEDIIIDNVATGIRLNDTQNITFYNNFNKISITTLSKFGINASSTNPVNDNIFNDIFTGCSSANCVGVQIQNGNNNKFYGFRAEPSLTTGTVGIKLFDRASGDGTFDNTFFGSYLEANGTGILVVAGTSGGGVSRNSFIGGIADANNTNISDAGSDTMFLNFDKNFVQYSQQPATVFKTAEVTTGTPDLTLDTLTANYAAGGPIVAFNQGGQTVSSIYSSAGASLTNPFLSFSVSPSNTAPVEAARFNSSGNFGIGSTSPSTKLVVAGTATVQNLVATGTLAVTSTSTLSGNTVIGGQVTSYNGTSILDVPIVVAKAHVSASTTTGTLLSYTVPSDGFYDIRIILYTSAISVDTIRVAIHFTDPDNIANWYYVCTALATAPSSCTSNIPASVKAGTTITTGTELVVSGGSVTYSAASTIIKETSY